MCDLLAGLQRGIRICSALLFGLQAADSTWSCNFSYTLIVHLKTIQQQGLSNEKRRLNLLLEASGSTLGARAELAEMGSLISAAEQGTIGAAGNQRLN